VADKKVSLIIVAKDAASATIKATGAAISKIASGITGAFKMAGGAAQTINAGLELVKKVLGTVGAAYDATVAKALALRGANDPARKDIEALGKAASDLQASIGDALIPVVRAFAQVLTPVIQGVSQWMKANRDLVTTKVLEWTINLARALTSGVATALLMVTRAWYGMRFAINAVMAFTKAYFANVTSWAGSFLSTLSGVADALGQTGIGGDLAALAAQSERWSAELGTAASKDVDAMLAVGLEMQKTERTIDSVVDTINNGLGTVAVKAVDNLSSSVVKASTAVRTLKGDADGAYQAWLAFNQATAKTSISQGADDLSRSLKTASTESERLAKNIELQSQVDSGMDTLRKQYGAAADAAFAATGSIAGATVALEEQESSISTVRDAVGSVISSIGSAFTGMIDAAIDGTKSASDIIGGFFGSIGRSILDTIIGIAVQFAATKLTEALLGSLVARTAITNYAAQAGAAAFASTAAIPIIGPLLAPGAATAAYAGAIAFQGLAMAEGGLVTGGVVGQDSVPAMMMPGEYVVPAAQVRQNVAAGRAPDDSGSARGGSGGRGVTVVNNFAASTFADSPANMERKATTAARTFQRVARRAVGIG
jgi:hypothetical protein